MIWPMPINWASSAQMNKGISKPTARANLCLLLLRGGIYRFMAAIMRRFPSIKRIDSSTGGILGLPDGNTGRNALMQYRVKTSAPSK